jgi:CheY-like chemotaxis protein
MDMHMPIMDGFEAADEILALNIGVPIVAMTANVMTRDKEQYVAHGMSGYVGKPFTSHELWRCLMKYIPVKGYTGINKRSQNTEEEKLLNKLRINFVKTNQNTATDIVRAAEAGDVKLAHRLAHTLKGYAGQIGENKLSRLAAAVENRISDGKNLDDDEMHNLKTELKSVLERLALLPADIHISQISQKPQPISREKLRDLFSDLEPMLKEKDTDCLQFAELFRTLPEAEELADLIEDFNFKAALNALDILRRDLVEQHG